MVVPTSLKINLVERRLDLPEFLFTILVSNKLQNIVNVLSGENERVHSRNGEAHANTFK